MILGECSVSLAVSKHVYIVVYTITKLVASAPGHISIQSCRFVDEGFSNFGDSYYYTSSNGVVQHTYFTVTSCSVVANCCKQNDISLLRVTTSSVVGQFFCDH